MTAEVKSRADQDKAHHNDCRSKCIKKMKTFAKDEWLQERDKQRERRKGQQANRHRRNLDGAEESEPMNR
jgi:hypothetical protein